MLENNVMLIVKEYTYLYDLLQEIKNGKKPSLDELHIFGGRKSGKSVSVQIFFCLLIMLDKKLALFAMRNATTDSLELYDELVGAMEGMDLKYTSSSVHKRIRYGVNTIRVLGLNSNKKGQAAKKAGLARVANAKYIIRYWEEAYEYAENDKLAVKEATRTLYGEEVYVFDIFVGNPWSKGHPYVAWLGSIQPWDIQQLKKRGSQFGIYEIKIGEGKEARFKRIAIHYTNWRVAQQVLSNDEIKSMLDTWNYDRNRALTVDYGLPGYEVGAIYTHLLHKIGKAVYKEHDYLLAGGDYGWSQRASGGKTAFYFLGFSYTDGCDVYGEYYHDNAKQPKDTNLLAYEIIQFYLYNMREYMKNLGFQSPINLRVSVDNANIALIQLLNNEVNKAGHTWLKFIPCSKYPIGDRILLLQTMIGSQNFRISNNVSALLSELEMSRYEEIETQKRMKDADHCLNGLEYALERIQYQFLKYIGNEQKLIKREKRSIWM